MPLPYRTINRFQASRALALACGLAFAAPVFAQLFDNVDWKESIAPPPPALDTKHLIPIELPVHMTLRYGIDPASLAITGDGVVRYVVVASSPSGAVNAFYEGVRCATAEMKTYARSTGGEWHVVQTPNWKPIRDMISLHTEAVAQQGLCRGRAPRASVKDIVQNFKQPLHEVE
jgi:hypothetical protein